MDASASIPMEARLDKITPLSWMISGDTLDNRERERA
jgi:hypothetical protein